MGGYHHLVGYGVRDSPWGVVSEDNLDTELAATVLDEDHDGLMDGEGAYPGTIWRCVNCRPIGRLSRQGGGAGAILALVGPPESGQRASAG